MTNITQLPAQANMTVEQALKYVLQENLQEVLIVGTDQDGDLVVRSSGMPRKDALWLAACAQAHSMGELGQIKDGKA